MHKRAVAAVALLGLVVLATVAILVAQRDREPQPQPTEPVTPLAATMLVQVRDPSLLAMGSVLMGVDAPRTHLDQLWWTPDWWIDQIGPQEVSAAELGRKPVQYAMQTLESQVQVPVDDAWVMDRLAFAGLIDAVSGVRLDLAMPTAYLDEQGLPQILEAGTQTLAGAQAADYVLDPSLRNEALRLQRFQAVWDQVLRRFPADQERSRALVVSLGVLSKTTMTTEELADFMTQANRLRIAGDSSQSQVPLEPDNAVRVRPPQGVRTAYALSVDLMPLRMANVFVDHPRPEDPVARINAAAIRDEDLEVLRGQLLGRGWQTAWGGRTAASTTAIAVDPSVPEADVTGLEQAIGITPQSQELPWGDAQVDVARPVGS